VKELCAICDVCSSFMPEQKNPRVLEVDKDGEKPAVLVIDDQINLKDYAEGIYIAHELLGRLIADFSYTSTIRCEYEPGRLSDIEADTAVAKCSVWTHHLLDNRKVILTTQRGLTQMGIKGRKEGDIFRSGKYGLILCVYPLRHMRTEEVYFPTFKAKTQRLLKEAGLI